MSQGRLTNVLSIAFARLVLTAVACSSSSSEVRLR